MATLGQSTGIDMGALATLLGIVTILVGGATAYLRLYVGHQIEELRRLINENAEQKYVSKERFTDWQVMVERRLDGLETTGKEHRERY